MEPVRQDGDLANALLGIGPAGTMTEAEGMTADRRLYVDALGRVVEADSPDKVMLVAAQGKPISKALADKLRLSMDEKAGTLTYPGYVAPEPEGEAEAAPAERAATKMTREEGEAPAPRSVTKEGSDKK